MMDSKTPKIKFKIWTESWKNCRLSEICDEFIGGGTPSTQTEELWQGSIPWVSSSDIFEDKIHGFQTTRFISEKAVKTSAAKKIPKGSVMVVSRVGVGKVAVTQQEIATSQDFTNLVINNQYSPTFTAYYFKAKNNKLVSIAQGTSIKGFTTGDLKSFKIYFPSLPEQQKIASFLTSVDERIDLLERKREKLEAYKKGVMQQIFSRQIRFKQDDGREFPDWEEKELGEVTSRVTRKNKENNQNVLTISGRNGLINQREYFNHAVAAKDVTGYYLLKKGEFAYNKSYSSGYPMGAIKKLNSFEAGVVSTLYICFKFDADLCSEFFEHYFESGIFNKEISKIAQEGARNHGLLNVSVVEFFRDLNVFVPQFSEQKKIAAFLNALDENLKTVNSQIQSLCTWKKGLLQQMFV